MRFLKALLIFTLSLFFLLGISGLITAKLIQPTIKYAGEDFTSDSQQTAALENTIKIKLANQVVKALLENKNEIIIGLTQRELDALIKTQLATANPPPEAKLLGSRFSIEEGTGKLQVGIRLLDLFNIGVTARFAVYYQKDFLIFQLDRLMLGRLPLPGKVTGWLMQKLADQHASANPHLYGNSQVPGKDEPNLSLDFKEPKIYPFQREIHFPVDWHNDYLTLTDVFFANKENEANDGLLILTFKVNRQEFNQQILKELKQLLP